MRRHLFFSLILVLGLGLGLSSCAPGVYTSASVGSSYGYPVYGNRGYYRPQYYAPRYYAPRYYAPRPIIVAPRPIIVTPRASYPGRFSGVSGAFGAAGAATTAAVPAANNYLFWQLFGSFNFSTRPWSVASFT